MSSKFGDFYSKQSYYILLNRIFVCEYYFHSIENVVTIEEIRYKFSR